MEAVVNMKMTPAEFDTMRTAVEGQIARGEKFIADGEGDPRERQAVRAGIVRLNDLLKKIS